jgi:sulfite exporter TauE/SafE
VLAAMATGSIWAGVLTMLLFWLGGLPVMLSAPQLIRKIISGTPERNQRLAGLILVISSAYSLCIFMWAH